jgi:hypothetical protein
MSEEQEKDPILLKRVQGGDGGMDRLRGPGVQLRSSGKKTQGKYVGTLFSSIV